MVRKNFRVFGLFVAYALSSGFVAAQDAAFDEELQIVDSNASFEYIINEAYGTNEWSVDGLTIHGGSVAALEHGAGEALYAMGFRFYAPWAFRYPDQLKQIELSRQKFVMPYNRIWYSYGQKDNLLKQKFKRWQILNNVADRRRPGGHSWKNIISKNSSIYNRNPQWLRDKRTFELIDPDAYAANVEICARYLLTRLNEEYRTNFDPSDSDVYVREGYDSELIYKFALDVVTKMRETEPRAELGIYAYAGHRMPVSYKLPGIYIQVALAYNDTWLTYPQLVRRHGAVADAIMLREYFDVEAWFRSMPMMNLRNKRDYYTKNYPDYIGAGVIGANGQFNANWLANIVAINHGIRFMKKGEGDYEDVLDEIIQDVFDGDPAVRALYMLWSDPGTKFDVYSLERSFELVVEMKNSWYKDLFKKYMTFTNGFRQLGNKTADGYADRLGVLLSQSEALKESDIIHSYAFQRRLAHGNVAKDFPHLWMFRKYPPDWKRNPVMPTDADFETAMTATIEDAKEPKLLYNARKLRDRAVSIKNKAIKKLLRE